MRARIHFHAKALAFSLSAVSFTLITTFFFYDGPIRMPHMEATVQASEVANQEEIIPTNTLLAANPQKTASHKPPVMPLPASLQNAWKPVALDNNQIRLQMLAKPFHLSETTHQVGSEAFDYASFLFDQIANGIRDAGLSAKLQTLSLRAQTMGNALRQASSVRFDGAPSEDMQHLQVRSTILFQLQGLNPNALITAQYNQHGKLLHESTPAKGIQSGEELKAFLSQAQEVLNHPMAKQYPRTMELIRQESALLKEVANHVTLRWESTLYCQHSCDSIATYMRVYTRQTLPAQTLAAVLP